MEIIDELIANLTYTLDYSVVGFSDNTIMIIASNNDESKRYRGIPILKSSISRCGLFFGHLNCDVSKVSNEEIHDVSMYP
jgi:hypothetical protein